jgi:hypothetical protein
MMKSVLPTILLPSLTTAVNVFPHHRADGTCDLPYTEIEIGGGYTYDLAGPANCVCNPDSDIRFDMLVCAGPQLSGECIKLSDVPKSAVGGFFNWQIGFDFLSMKRSG